MNVSGDTLEAERRDRFRAVYEANYHRILGFALRRAPEADAADVVAETFLVAWRRFGDLPEGDEARLWLYATARRVLANQDRARRRRERLAERVRGERHEPELGPESHTTGPAAKAFGALRERDRELLSLSIWEGLDARQIAQVCGCSRNAARIRLHRARRRFAQELSRHERLEGRQPIATFAKEETP